MLGAFAYASWTGLAMGRSKHRDEFLAEHGWKEANIVTLAADASFRCYYRLELSGQSAVLMDAPPAHEDIRPFVAVAQYLLKLKLSAPRILGQDTNSGFLLIEDLGDEKFNTLLKTADKPNILYKRAIDVLCVLHKAEPPSWLSPYSHELLLAEVDLLVDWYWPTVTGTTIDSSTRTTYRNAWIEVFSAVKFGPPVTVLRDYHSDNLMWLPNRNGVAAVGLLDFQDALTGSPAYDLVSLLEDARRDVSGTLVENMIQRYVSATGTPWSSIERAYSVLGAQRNSKIIGIFSRLWRRDKKAAYLTLIPRVWRLLENNLTDPLLAPVRLWFDQHLPKYLRRKPQ